MVLAAVRVPPRVTAPGSGAPSGRRDLLDHGGKLLDGERFSEASRRAVRCTDGRHIDLFEACENDYRWSRRRRIDCFQDRQTARAWVQINDNHIHLIQAAVQDAKGFEARVRPNHVVTAFHCREGNELGRIWISLYEEQNIRFHLKQINDATRKLWPSLAISCA